jgi:cytochrome b involved in lipid metabolism
MSWTLSQVAGHNTSRYITATYVDYDRLIEQISSSCWVIINNKVYDVTDFLPVSTLSTYSILDSIDV